MRVEDYIGTRLEELCATHSITKYRLSQQTGISQSTLGHIIKKERIPTVISLEKICDAFNISLAQFFLPDTKVENDLSQEQIELLGMWNQLSVGQRNHVKMCIQNFIEGMV